MRGDPAARRGSGKAAAGSAGRSDPCGGDGFDFGAELIAAEREVEGIEVSGAVVSKWAKGSGGPAGNECYNLVAFDALSGGVTAHAVGDVPGALHGGRGGGRAAIAGCSEFGVRRLTPLECERLQGLPDGWTDVVWRGRPASDRQRYIALGNSMAVNVMDWIGERIEVVRGAMEVANG